MKEAGKNQRWLDCEVISVLDGVAEIRLDLEYYPKTFWVHVSRAHLISCDGSGKVLVDVIDENAETILISIPQETVVTRIEKPEAVEARKAKEQEAAKKPLVARQFPGITWTMDVTTNLPVGAITGCNWPRLETDRLQEWDDEQKVTFVTFLKYLDECQDVHELTPILRKRSLCEIEDQLSCGFNPEVKHHTFKGWANQILASKWLNR